VLSELTQADMENLGVLLDHRKKLLKAIAALAREMRAPRTLVATRPGRNAGSSRCYSVI
jgi:hypothetical protein